MVAALVAGPPGEQHGLSSKDMQMLCVASPLMAIPRMTTPGGILQPEWLEVQELPIAGLPSPHTPTPPARMPG